MLTRVFVFAVFSFCIMSAQFCGMSYQYRIMEQFRMMGNSRGFLD